jgi:hypothetical protein
MLIFAANKLCKVMEATVFNPIQMHLIRMFERNTSESELLELQSVISNYYAKKMDEHLDKLWDEGILDQKRLDEINEMDLHAWLREQKGNIPAS